MKKSTFVSLLILVSCGLVGFTPDKGFDYAEYKRLPFEKRITRLQKAGEDLFLRRRYEDSIKVFETILKLKENDLSAKLWLSKAHYEIKREKEEADKAALYRKYNGHLLPEDKIYVNWKFGPEIGHFEVRYSEPKPRPVYKKKDRPWATEEVINNAIAKAKSGKAVDTFELAMLYWSRKDVPNALKYYYKACQQDSELLGNDDEGLIYTVLSGLEAKIKDGKAEASDYFEAGKINLFQSNVEDGIKLVLKSASLDRKNYASLSKKIIGDYLDTVPTNNLIERPEVAAYRQAYVHDKGEDYLYIYMNVTPRNGSQIFYTDLSFPFDMVSQAESLGTDLMHCFAKSGMDKTARIWFLLPEKKSDDFSSYEIKCRLKLNREKSEVLELSNYDMSDLFDNWTFIIGNEVNFSSLGNGVNEFNEEGLRVSGHHLHLFEGRGPYIKFADFKEDFPPKMEIKDMFALMIPMEYELDEQPVQATAENAPIPTSAEYSSEPKNETDIYAGPKVVYEVETPRILKPNKTNTGNANTKQTPSLPAGDINDMDIGL